MVSKVKENKINFKGKMVNIGVDMHKLSWRIKGDNPIVSRQGKI